MKSILVSAVAAVILCAPVVSFAQQSDAPVTRAQVRAELKALSSVGYTASAGDDNNYPADIQAAEAKLDARRAMTTASTTADPAAIDSVGGVAVKSESGTRRIHSASQAACVGPAGFCVPYFGS